MVILSRLEQELNADLPIDVTLSGMVILSRLVQSLNANSLIDFTPSGILYEVLVLPAGYFINSSPLFLNNTPSTDE